VGIFSPLATAYRRLIHDDSVFGATKIDNYQFLRFYQQARLGIQKNIPSAWRGAGLVPFNPDYVLIKYRPTTPFASLTDQFGNRVNIQVNDDVSKQINGLISQILGACPTPLRPGLEFLKTTALTAIADNKALRVINQGLVDKQKKVREARTKKYHSKARILTVDDMIKQQEERAAREEAEGVVRVRKAALRGKIGFAKLVWRELAMDIDLFD